MKQILRRFQIYTTTTGIQGEAQYRRKFFFPKKFGDIDTFGDMGTEIIFLLENILTTYFEMFFNFTRSFIKGSNELKYQNV
jgi:hypothetical protein